MTDNYFKNGGASLVLSDLASRQCETDGKCGKTAVYCLPCRARNAIDQRNEEVKARDAAGLITMCLGRLSGAAIEELVSTLHVAGYDRLDDYLLESGVDDDDDEGRDSISSTWENARMARRALLVVFGLVGGEGFAQEVLQNLCETFETISEE